MNTKIEKNTDQDRIVVALLNRSAYGNPKLILVVGIIAFVAGVVLLIAGVSTKDRLLAFGCGGCFILAGAVVCPVCIWRLKRLPSVAIFVEGNTVSVYRDHKRKYLTFTLDQIQSMGSGFSQRKGFLTTKLKDGRVIVRNNIIDPDGALDRLSDLTCVADIEDFDTCDGAFEFKSFRFEKSDADESESVE